MANRYDVAVVGAGPAGMLAATAAARAGLKVALLERKQDITRLERMCGQTLVSMNDYYFDDLVHYNREGKRIVFMASGFSLPYDGPVKNCYAWHIFSPSGNRLAFGVPKETRQRGDYGAVGLAYDKEILFRCLLNEAAASGVEVFTGVDVTDVSAEPDEVTVRGGNQTVNAAYLIAADGTNSRIARLLGFNRERTFFCYLLSRGWYVRGLSPPEPDMLISSIAYMPVAPGYMFIFPRPYADDATVVFLTLDPRVNLDEVAGYFMKDNPFFAAWFKDAERLEQHASAQYIFSPVREPFRQRVLLAGDSGSCQELENTGAMISGWKAGNAVAAALKEDRVGMASRAIADYVAWWQTTYIQKCPHEAYMMNFALPFVVDTAEDFDYICSLVKEPLPPCWNPYAAMSHMGTLMQSLVPSIQKERPDLMPKLARMSAPLSEILKGTTEACKPFAEFA